MSKKDLKLFLDQLNINPKLQSEVNNIANSNLSPEEKKSELIQIAKNNNFNFTEKEVFNLRNSLSDLDLENVSGGFSGKTVTGVFTTLTIFGCLGAGASLMTSAFDSAAHSSVTEASLEENSASASETSTLNSSENSSSQISRANTPELKTQNKITDNTTTEQTKGKDTTPAQTNAKNTTPAQTNAKDTTPAQTNAKNSTSTQTNAKDTTPAQTNAKNTTPAQINAKDTTPAQTNVKDTKSDSSADGSKVVKARIRSSSTSSEDASENDTNSNTTRQIINSAQNTLPQDYNNVFDEKAKKTINDSCNKPDEDEIDYIWAYHFYDPDTGRNFLNPDKNTEQDFGSKTVKATALTALGINDTELEEKSNITALSKMTGHYREALNLYRAGHKTASMEQLGRAIHYMEDLNTPVHTHDENIFSAGINAVGQTFNSENLKEMLKTGQFKKTGEHSEFEKLCDDYTKNPENYKYEKSLFEGLNGIRAPQEIGKNLTDYGHNCAVVSKQIYTILKNEYKINISTKNSNKEHMQFIREAAALSVENAKVAVKALLKQFYNDIKDSPISDNVSDYTQSYLLTTNDQTTYRLASITSEKTENESNKGATIDIQLNAKVLDSDNEQAKYNTTLTLYLNKDKTGFETNKNGSVKTKISYDAENGDFGSQLNGVKIDPIKTNGIVSAVNINVSIDGLKNFPIIPVNAPVILRSTTPQSTPEIMSYYSIDSITEEENRQKQEAERQRQAEAERQRQEEETKQKKKEIKQQQQEAFQNINNLNSKIKEAQKKLGDKNEELQNAELKLSNANSKKYESEIKIKDLEWLFKTADIAKHNSLSDNAHKTFVELFEKNFQNVDSTTLDELKKDRDMVKNDKIITAIQEELEKSNQELKAVEKEIDATQQELKAAQEEVKAAQKEVDNLKATIENETNDDYNIAFFKEYAMNLFLGKAMLQNTDVQVDKKSLGKNTLPEFNNNNNNNYCTIITPTICNLMHQDKFGQVEEFLNENIISKKTGTWYKQNLFTGSYYLYQNTANPKIKHQLCYSRNGKTLQYTQSVGLLGTTNYKSLDNKKLENRKLENELNVLRLFRTIFENIAKYDQDSYYSPKAKQNAKQYMNQIMPDASRKLDQTQYYHEQ